MQNLRLARRYAKALVLAAAEADILPLVRQACEELHRLLQESPEFQQFVTNTLIPSPVKRERFTQIFGEHFHPLWMSFWNLLVDHRRERHLEAVLEEILQLLDKREGKEQALVRSAIALSEEQTESLSAALSRMRGTRVQLQTQVDPTLRGGFVVYLADTVVDASLTTQLERLREAMIEGS